ncbi:glycosyltransferase family 4 protein [Ureibacillus manganicus]|uniref:Glycosyl transferase n=1 Tax=Ureibacillus manganicus DSM 26584 TaxID=1384049 RepID=A0A0A3HUR9_9BACL|nr:glycosyltransferase family 4 protein [Ureibacillus manganicus]KGR76194.1 glycosyl transferase [Ureibacillus manganicus DSM 26584]
MKKKIWIFNHYATNMYKDKNGRHYAFAKYLLKDGYQPTIFCASTMHNSDEDFSIAEKKYTIEEVNHIPFVFIKTPKYDGNGKQRVNNMLAFYKNLFPVAKELAKIHGKPDVILASSVHPLTCVAGIKIAKKLGIPCVCEIRDLWPESIVDYGLISEKNLFTKLMFMGEKWIYKTCDRLIFTMEGGRDYIIEKGWNKENGGPVDLAKVFHINNGVDLEAFQFNQENNRFDDPDLENPELFKVVYAGSIRKANNVKKIVDIADVIRQKGYHHIKFLIYGRGPEKEQLEKYCQENNIWNVEFKGYIDKNKIPYLLSKSNLNIMHIENTNLKKYGASLNKMFEYFASGKPTITDCEFGYDLLKKYECGITLDGATKEQLADAIIEISNPHSNEYETYCKNALIAASDYDFKVLTKQLEQIL